MVRGVADDGSDLVISRDYISHGLRSRAADLVSAELGPRFEHEIRAALAREVEAERWTRLDAAIRMAADDIGFIDLRPDNPGEGDPQARRLAVGRLQKLGRMDLATAAGPDHWMIGPKAEPVLRDLGMRGDIIKTIDRAFTERGQDRGVADYVIDVDTASSLIIGSLVATGLPDELTGHNRSSSPWHLGVEKPDRLRAHRRSAPEAGKYGQPRIVTCGGRARGAAPATYRATKRRQATNCAAARSSVAPALRLTENGEQGSDASAPPAIASTAPDLRISINLHVSPGNARSRTSAKSWASVASRMRNRTVPLAARLALVAAVSLSIEHWVTIHIRRMAVL